MPRHPPYTLNTLTTFALDTHGLLNDLFNCQRTFSGILFRKELGGAERARTADPLLAKQVLSQLSYSPIFGSHNQYLGSRRSHYLKISDGGPR